MDDESGEAYQSLYRRYRPQRFADVRGQDHVTTALRNAVRSGKVSHAYLFSGPRGTGKTSTARILAMALDCEHPADGEPDGICPSCVEIRRGSSMDVQELDAASNRKLDEMRELLSRVALGTRGKWKVYIIDEVHQLTPDAASALLKTLEDPPAHVIFVLATTDPQKVLPTIRSRTQHFEFRLLSSEILAGLLTDINRQAALGVRPEALDLVVRRGHGSARDALSVLDQVAAAGDVEDETSVVSDVVEALADRDAGRALIAVAEGMAAGREPRRLATDLLDHLRNAFLAVTARGLLQLPDDAASVVEGQGRRLGLAGVVRAIETIGLAAAEMRDSIDPRVTLEVALVRVAAPAVDTDAAALLDRIERLEAQVAARPLAPAPRPVTGGGGVPAGTSAGTSPEEAGRGGPSTLLGGGEQDEDSGRPSGRPPRVDRAIPRRDEPRPPLGDPPPTPRSTAGATAQGAAAPPGPPPAPARSTIGAHRRGSPDVPRSPVAGAPHSDGSPVGSPGPGGAPGSTPAGRPPAPPSGGSSPALPAPSLPSRDELVKAWGDEVLPGLPARVKVYLAQGRFLAVTDAAVLALPDRGLLHRAEAVRGDAEGALAQHFGRHVPLRLVLDDGAAPAGLDRSPPGDEDDPSSYDLDDLEDAGAAVMSPEQRLLEAFPGAEEVAP